MKKNIFISLILTSFSSLALVNACNVKASAEETKPETKEEKIAREKKEIKEYFKNYDYLCIGAENNADDVSKFKESTIPENTLYTLEVQKNKFKNLFIHPDGQTYFWLVVSEDIFQKMNDVEWRLYLEKPESSNKLTFTIKDKKINNEIAQYENQINYFFSDIASHRNEWQYQDSYANLNYVFFQDDPETLEKIFGNVPSSLQLAYSLYLEKDLEKKAIERTEIKKAEVIWNTIKWIDTSLEQRLSMYGLTRVAKMFVKKEPNQKKLEYILQLPFSRYDYGTKTVDRKVKWIDFKHYLNLNPCPEELVATVKKLESINKTTFTKEKFISASGVEITNITQDNFEELKNKLGIEMTQEFLNSLDTDISLSVKKEYLIDITNSKAIKEDGQLFQTYEWTIKKGDKETKFNFYINDFGADASK